MGTPNNPPTILVVEDDAQVRSYLEISLRRMGYGIASAQDGEEGLSLLRSTKEISAILLDLMLPDCDGIEILEPIHNLVPGLPVIVISGAASTGNVVAAMRCGATDFLSKPVSCEELELSLTKALEMRAAAQTAERPLEYSSLSSSCGATKLFVGETPRMKELASLLTPVGWSEVPVLIREKPVAARRWSPANCTRVRRAPTSHS